MPDPNDEVRKLIQGMTERGELGLQVAAYLHGQIVIDAWAGITDETTREAVDGDTLFTVFSCTKGITFDMHPYACGAWGD